MKNIWLILFVVLGLALLSVSTAPEDRTQVIVIPSSACEIEGQNIDRQIIASLFAEDHSKSVNYRVNDLGVWKFVHKKDTLYRRIGVYPVSGQFVTHSALCWASTEDTIPHWLSRNKFRSEDEFSQLLEAESTFIQAFRSEEFHMGWASQMPIPETELARKEIEEILGDSIWIPGITSIFSEEKYSPVFALFSLYQSFYNSNWIREMIAQKIEMTASIYCERKWAVRFNLGAIQAADISSAIVQIEVYPHSSLVYTFSPCSTYATPTAPYLKAIEIFNQKASSLKGSDDLQSPSWCRY